MKQNLTLAEQVYIANYKLENKNQVQDVEFANWLENEYIPLGGKWQY